MSRSILKRAKAWAKRYGYGDAEVLHLKNGKTVYLLQPKEYGQVIGVPQYLIVSATGSFILSSYAESMALFDEPDYMREE